MAVMKALAVSWIMVVAGVTGTPEPGPVAVEFLEKVRAKSLNLEPGGDTALSPQTSEAKRREIARRLERLTRDLGADPLEVGAVKLDGELAAVLVRKIGGFDPSRLQVFPVALVKRAERWRVAPVPASFANAGIGYAADLRARLALLEDWMLREQARDLENLREQTADRLRQEIRLTLPDATLRGFTSEQAAERFLTACGRGTLPEILGLLGGLSVSLPNDWPARLRAADRAVAAAAGALRPWRLLLSSEVLRVPVAHEEDGNRARVSIACLDPAGNLPKAAQPQVELVHLELSKSSDGGWRIDLPARFLQEMKPDDETRENPDVDLLNAFPAKLAALGPPVAQPSAPEACRSLLATLQSGSLSSLMCLMRLDGDPAAARKACVRAAQFWWAMREPTSVHQAVPLAMKQDAQSAVQACQFFAARMPDRLDLRFLYFEKSAEGWYWAPQPRAETESSWSEWVDAQAAQCGPNQWQQVLLTECHGLDALPELAAPTEEQSRQLMASWFQALRAGDLPAALRLSTRLNQADSASTLLRNLGYELTGARLNPQAPAIAGIQSSGIWTAVATRTGPPEARVCPVYPVLTTPAGPRILLEIDLVASTQRSRDFLNKTALERLQKSSQPAAALLKQLFSELQERAEGGER
jgi:hypothetical protein